MIGIMHFPFYLSIFFSTILFAYGDIANLIVDLNSTAIESRTPASSPSSSDSESATDFGNAFMTVDFENAYSASVTLKMNFQNFSNVNDVSIYEGGMFTPSGGNLLFNLTPKFNSLSQLNAQKLANLSFTVSNTEVFPFDAVYANPTNYFLMLSNSDGGIRGQFGDNSQGYTPQGYPDVSSNDILNGQLSIVSPPPQLQGINYFDGTVQLFFIPLNDGSYIVEYFITSYANDTSAVELYKLKSNDTVFDFKDSIRLPSLNKNAEYRGQLSSFSKSTASAMLSSPSSYGFRMITAVNGTQIVLAGGLNTMASQTPPPPSPIPSPPPPASVDTGSSIGVPGASSASFLKLSSLQICLLCFLSTVVSLQLVFQ